MSEYTGDLGVWIIIELYLCSFKNVTIPQRDDGRMASVAKRFESSRPLGMFRSSENEFLLCYDGELYSVLIINASYLFFRIRCLCRPIWRP